MFSHTFLSMRFSSLVISSAVRSAVSCAANRAVSTVPSIIHSTAKARARVEWGDLSPYLQF